MIRLESRHLLGVPQSLVLLARPPDEALRVIKSHWGCHGPDGHPARDRDGGCSVTVRGDRDSLSRAPGPGPGRPEPWHTRQGLRPDPGRARHG